MFNEFYELDEYGEALILYNNYLKLDTSLEMVFYNKGFCEKMLFKYEASTKSFKKALKLNYRIGDAYHSIAWNYAAENNDSLALYYFKEAYKLDTTDMDILEQIEIFTHRLNR